MAQRHARVATVPEYQPFHITSTGTALPVGLVVGTTASTVVAGAGAATITPVSMAGIVPGMLLRVSGGVGSTEVVTVTATTATTFTASFAGAHSGTYNIVSLKGTFIGNIVTNQAGSGITITLYNGSPSDNPAGTAIAAITPVAGTAYGHQGRVDRGLYVTVAGTTAGDYTIWYLDDAL